MTIKEQITNNKTGFLISGTGKKYIFTPSIYFNSVKFIMKKFKISFEAAKSQINYMLVTDIILKNKKYIHQFKTDKKTTNIRLKNVINFDYTWHELWNK